jgi:hypothetical protein
MLIGSDRSALTRLITDVSEENWERFQAVSERAEQEGLVGEDRI